MVFTLLESTFVRAVYDFSPADMNAAETVELRKSLLREERNEAGYYILEDYSIESYESFDPTQMALSFVKGEHFEIRDLLDIG